MTSIGYVLIRSGLDSEAKPIAKQLPVDIDLPRPLNVGPLRKLGRMRAAADDPPSCDAR